MLLSCRPPPHRLGPAQPPGLGARGSPEPALPGPPGRHSHAAGPGVARSPRSGPARPPGLGACSSPELTLPGPLRQAAPATHPVLPTHLTVSLDSWLRVPWRADREEGTDGRRTFGVPAPGLNVSSKTEAGADSGSRPGWQCRESAGEGRELLGGPSDLQETGRRWALGDPSQDGSLPCSRSLSEPREGKASGSEPEMPPPPTGPPGSGPACSGLGAHRAPLDCPALMQAGRRHVFPGPCPLALLGFTPSPPPHPPGSRAAPLGRSGQPTADLPTPVLAGQAAGFQRTVSLLVCMLGEQPHIKGEKKDTF